MLRDRRTTSVIEKLFERVHALKLIQSRPPPEEVAWTGFNALIFKAPFTDLGNWAPLRSWPFAVAMERRLLESVNEAIRKAVDERLGVPVNRDARSVLEAFHRLLGELAANDFTTTLLILAGPLGTQLVVDLQKVIVGNWTDEVKRDLGTTFRILGTYSGNPILDIPDSPIPGIYAVDLAQFGELTRYGESPEFSLQPISQERARSLHERNPQLGTPSGAASRVTHPIRQLQLKVTLELFETYVLRVENQNAVAGSPFVGPVLEWEPEGR